jgi:glyoxylase-like metal-dependent hydrolase (beta-lactamase superfamily II)
MALCVLLAVGLRLLATSPTPAPSGSPVHFRLVPVARGIYAAIATPGDRESGANAGFIVGEDSVLVVDTFLGPDAARELLAEARRVTSLPVRWVVNTHYHLDHVGGNGVFAAAGAAIVGHENLRAWIRTENLRFRPTEKERIESLPLPEVTHRQGLTIWLGSRRVDVLFRPGHTGGDSVVSVPDADAVFAGDLFWNATVPNLIDADTAAWQKTVEGFLDRFPKSVFVPGHGEPGHALDVRFFRDYLLGLRQAVGRAVEQGKAGKDLADAVLPVLKAKFGAWTWFDQFALRNIEQTEQEWRGTKRRPQPEGNAGS